MEALRTHLIRLLLTLALIAAPALARATPADTTESEPAPLIVPPRVPPVRTPADSPVEPPPADTAVAAARERAREYFGRGLALEQQRAFPAAIMSYFNAARLDPTLRGPSLRMGRLFASKQEWRSAQSALREELRRDPDNPVVQIEYSLACAEVGDTTRAMRRLEAMTRTRPGDARVWRALGHAYGVAQRLPQAEKALRSAVNLDAKLALAWTDLGAVLAAQGRTVAARDAFQRALALDAADLSTLLRLANLESRAGENERALGHYRAAARVDSTSTDAWRGQVRELVALRRMDEVSATWRRWLAIAPEEPEVREGAARHFVHLGRLDAALEVARGAVRRSARGATAWWLLGEMQSEAADWSSALESYGRALEFAKDEGDAGRAVAGFASLRERAPAELVARIPADSLAALRRRADPADGTGSGRAPR